MAMITISVVVGDDRRLVIELPPAIPLGPVEVTIRSHEDVSIPMPHPTRDAARATLIAAGFLDTTIHAPPGTARLSDAEIARIGTLPTGARPSEELVAEDRGSF